MSDDENTFQNIQNKKTNIDENKYYYKNMNNKFKFVFIANNIIFFRNDRKLDLNNEYDPKGITLINNFGNFEIERILQMKSDKCIYSNLAKSISPNIYGLDDVKKGLLLMLCGGVNKYTYEGLKLHGNINICLIGEPSTSKTQFLKYLYDSNKNSIYLNGRDISTTKVK